MTNRPVPNADSHASKSLHVSLWIAQALLSLIFVGTGIWKLLTPIQELAAMIPWAGEVPLAVLQGIALIDLCGGLGILLPTVTRIKPGLAVIAALGCALLQVCAIVFHLQRGEAANTPFNFLLVGIALFIAWGRQLKARVQPRA